MSANGDDEEPPFIEGEPRDEPIGEDIVDIPFAVDEFLVEVNGENRVEVEVDGRRHTVEARETLDFEERLASDIIVPDANDDSFGANVPIKGRWIHGWLVSNTEDYINNVWHNWQFFLRYLEGRSKSVSNVGTIQRSPGTYDTMYNYLMTLEKLGVIERHRRKQVPQSEYDRPVPEEFRTRTFIRVIENIDERPDAWRNPFDALYGGEREAEEADEQEDGDEDGVTELVERIQEEDGDDEEQEQPSSLQERFKQEVDEISQFQKQEELISFIQSAYENAIEETFRDPPVPTRDISADDFTLAKVAVFGPWADSRGEVGETPLSMVISIDDRQAQNSPKFIPLSVSNEMETIMNQQNEFDSFPSYNIDNSVYVDAFEQTIESAVINNQENEQYYDLGEGEFVEL